MVVEEGYIGIVVFRGMCVGPRQLILVIRQTLSGHDLWGAGEENVSASANARGTCRRGCGSRRACAAIS